MVGSFFVVKSPQASYDAFDVINGKRLRMIHNCVENHVVGVEARGMYARHILLW